MYKAIDEKYIWTTFILKMIRWDKVIYIALFQISDPENVE